MKYKAISATTNKIKESFGGTSEFTFNALDQLAASAKGKPVLLEFNINRKLGTVESGFVEGNKLIIIFNLDCDIVNPDCRLVPGFQVDKDSWEEGENIHRIIDNTIMLSCGLTMEPLEIDLPEIERMDGEGGSNH